MNSERLFVSIFSDYERLSSLTLSDSERLFISTSRSLKQYPWISSGNEPVINDIVNGADVIYNFIKGRFNADDDPYFEIYKSSVSDEHYAALYFTVNNQLKLTMFRVFDGSVHLQLNLIKNFEEMKRYYPNKLLVDYLSILNFD